MELTQKPSRKRKQSSINTPFSGILTRQKSHKFFFNRNRSGFSRKCRSFQPSVAQIPAKITTRFDDGCHVSIKDLRARRVVLEPPEIENVGKVDNPRVDCDLIDCKVDYFDGGNPNCVMLDKCDLGFDGGDFNLANELIVKCDDFGGENPNLVVDLKKCETMINSGNPNLNVLKKCVDNGTGNPKLPVLKKFDFGDNDENPSLLGLEKSNDSRVNVVTEGLNGGDLKQSISFEKCDSVTNWEIPDVFGGGMSSSREGFDVKSLEDMTLDLSNNFVEGGVVGNCEVLNDDIVQTTPPDAVVVIRNSEDLNVLKSRSYSKEMTLNKCSRRKVFKVPNSFTYKRLLPYLMDMAKDEPCTTNANPSANSDIDGEEKPLDSIDGPQSTQKPLATMPVCVPQEMIINIKDEPHTVSPSSQINLVAGESEISDYSKQGISPEENISPDDIAITLQSPNTSPQFSKNDAPLEPHSHFDMEFKGVESSTSPTKLDIVVSSSALVTKGILKRSPLGCRGLCSCLNCTSFRLNSEKAFEFSRNQLLETEEIADDLLKEISYLSSMLKKSVKGATEVGTVSTNQVEEACRRASNAEEGARTRLSQMHEDLFVHSRIKALQRPRVKFSGSVQEIVTKKKDAQQ